MLKLDKNVPLPSEEELCRGHRRLLYPLPHMEVGDSFVVPRERAQKARMSVSKWAQQHPGWKYRTAWVEGDSLRIWRIA